jgi:hypothetical protein
MYKKLDLNMRPTHVTFPTGGYNFDAGIQEMRNKFASGQLKIAAHLAEMLDEYTGYHLENGLVVKMADDLMSAIRVLCMDIRYAKSIDQFGGYAKRRGSNSRFARGTVGPPMVRSIPGQGGSVYSLH